MFTQPVTYFPLYIWPAVTFSNWNQHKEIEKREINKEKGML